MLSVLHKFVTVSLLSLLLNDATDINFEDSTLQTNTGSITITCASTIQQEVPKCPEGFIYVLEIDACLFITEPQTFPPECPFDDVIPFNNYINYIGNIEPIWMPVRRDLSNGLGFLQWIEASILYRLNFADKFYVNEPIKDKDCLLYYNSSFIQAVNCNEKHIAVCGYFSLNTLKNNVCKFEDHSCISSDFDSMSECFCLGTSQDDQTELIKIEIPKLYQNTVCDALTQDLCLIGLERFNNTSYIWTKSQKEITYTNWAPNRNYSDIQRFGARTQEGWLLLENEENSCFLYEVKPKNNEPNLELIVTDNRNVLQLKVSYVNNLKWLEVDTKLLVFCFTDATPLSLLYRYPSLNKIEQESNFENFSYRLNVASQGSGNYWCESFKYPGLEIIQSNVLYAKPKNISSIEFVSIVKLQYIRGTNPLTEGILEFLERVLYIKLNEIQHIKSFYTIRIMKILDIDEDKFKMLVNIHFSSKSQASDFSVEEEFVNMKYLLSDAVNAIDLIEMQPDDFRSSDFCFFEQTTDFNTELTWPTTAKGKETYPRQFCFKNDSSLISRRCEGSFIDGAKWARIDSPCFLVKNSSLTSNLTDLFGQDPEIIIRDIEELSKRFEEFEEIDVYLIAELFNEIKNSSCIDLEKFTKIISNIHQFKEDVLTSSQEKLNATDKLLFRIDEILLNSDLNHSTEIQFLWDRFYVIISQIKKSNLTAILIQSNNGSRVTPIYGNYNLSLIEDDMESLIYFSESFKQQMNDNDKLVVTIFFTDALFNEERQVKVGGFIFGVLLPEIAKNMSDSIQIFNKIKSSSDKSCAFWNYNVSDEIVVKGYWQEDNDIEFWSNTITLCQYYHATHFGLLVIDDNNIISSLDKYHILDIITTINCSLSLIGLLGILLTAILFKCWRSNTGNQILINFVIAILLQTVTFYLSNTFYRVSEYRIPCIIIGVLLHYALISQFCWMLIIAILQFKRFVEVLKAPPKYILLKACICGWGLPILPVGCILFTNPDNYISGKSGLCYPSGLGLYLGIWLPLAIIILINTIIFIYIIYNVAHRKTECVDTVNNEVVFQWRLAILLFFMLGLTWSFGLLSELDFGIFFIFIFCFTATLQGFIMFLFFIVFNKNTRLLYWHSIRSCCSNRSYY